jgi:hypothetical protein
MSWQPPAAAMAAAPVFTHAAAMDPRPEAADVMPTAKSASESAVSAALVKSQPRP